MNYDCDVPLTEVRGNSIHHFVSREADLAIYIVNQYPEIVNERDDEKMTALNLLATKQLSFKSGSDYLFEEIGKTPSVPVQMIETIIYSCKLTFYSSIVLVIL